MESLSTVLIRHKQSGTANYHDKLKSLKVATRVDRRPKKYGKIRKMSDLRGHSLVPGFIYRNKILGIVVQRSLCPALRDLFNMIQISCPGL